MIAYNGAPSRRIISGTLRQLGVTPNYCGYRYATLGVWLSVREPERLLLVTKWLYPEVAAFYHTTWGAVERSIRTVINVAWRQNPELLCQLANHKLSQKPCPGQFLSILSTGLFPDFGSGE